MAWHALRSIFNLNYLPISCIYIGVKTKDKYTTVDIMEYAAISWEDLGSATEAIEEGLQNVIERKGRLDDAV